MPVAPDPHRVLIIPGIDGRIELLESVAPILFNGLSVHLFDHCLDSAEGGLEGLAARALKLLDAEDATAAPAYICGESFGGLIALTLAHRFPARVRGLILMSTFGWCPTSSSRRIRLGLAVSRALGDKITGHLLAWSRPLSLLGNLGFPFEQRLACAFLTPRSIDAHGYRLKGELTLRFDARPWLRSIDCPAFVLTSTWDPIVPPRAGAELAATLPNARLHRLTGAHLVHSTRAVETGCLIGEWLAETSPVP
jgi:pimeloyl-ACP methyl ester carboxylesterase